MSIKRMVKELIKTEKYKEIYEISERDVASYRIVVGQLVKLLRSSNSEIRTRAAHMFSYIKDPSGLPGLLRMIKQGISANSRPHTSYDYFIHHFISVDRYVDIHGLERTLSFFHWAFQDYPGSKKSDVASATKATKSIAYMKDFSPLLRALEQENAETRELVADIFVQRSPEIPKSAIKEAIQTLLKASKQDSNVNVRRSTRLALRNIGTQATPILLEELNTQDHMQRYFTAWVLYWLWKQYHDSSAIAPIIAALDKEDMAVIAGAYYYFLEEGKPGTEPLLIKALNDYGQLEMATDYINCGNTLLQKAAEEWATKNGLTIVKSEYSRGRQWGIKG
jgi:hypothetical protein